MKFLSNLLNLNYKLLRLECNHSINLIRDRYSSNFATKSDTLSNDEIQSKVRLRFAPSPTGFMHIGGVRTAFINYLFAKKYDGQFILRIEDTDQKRVIKEAAENIQEVLEYFDIRPDEGPFSDVKTYGPYYQSERTEIYKKYANQLLEQGLAYRCFCDETLLKLLRDQAKKNRNIIGYDNRCRKLSKEQIEQNLANKMAYSIRFKLTEGEILFNDLVRGEMCFDLACSEPDFVILKSDQYPTYHLANVVDDHLMKISHVVRGMEWLKSTPKHLMLYKAFGWQAPTYAHLPLIYNPSGTKLSKRNEDINMINLKKNGVFKEAILNYLVTIGGGFRTDFAKNNDRIYDLDYFKQDFDENLLRPNSSQFDIKKIKFFNHLTIRHYFDHNREELINRLKNLILNDFKNAELSQLEVEPMTRLIKLTIKDKIQTYQELKKEYAFFWTDEFERDESVEISFDINQIKPEIIELFSKFDDMNWEESFKSIKSFCKEKHFDYGPFLQLIRYALTGKIKGPKIKEIYELLTKDLLIKRLDSGLDKIKKSS